MTQSKKTEQPVEGEGSYGATRRYNEHLGEAIVSGNLKAGADAARRALEGPEGKELARAAEQAKRGPKQKPSPPTPSGKKGGKAGK